MRGVPLEKELNWFGQTRYSSYPLWVIDFTAERSTQFSPRQEFRSAKISDLAYRHTVSLYTSAAVRFLVSKEQLALRYRRGIFYSRDQKLQHAIDCQVHRRV